MRGTRPDAQTAASKRSTRQTATRGGEEAKRLVLSTTIERRNEGCFHGVSASTTRQRSLNVRSGCIPSQPGPRRWALVQVWDGAELASFDHETGAREAMTGLDDDEVVVLCVGT